MAGLTEIFWFFRLRSALLISLSYVISNLFLGCDAGRTARHRALFEEYIAFAFISTEHNHVADEVVYSRVQLPTFKEQRPNPPGSAIQTTAAIVVALATVASVIAQSKDNPKLAVGLVVLSLLVLGWTFASRMIAFVQTRRVLAARNKAARTEHAELLRFARRFAQFTNTGDPTNIQNIIFISCANDPDKCAELCPPDYMRDLSPLFVQHFEIRPSENESQFLRAVQELYGLVGSYNNHYVLEPFERMRRKRWAIVNPSVLHTAMGTANPENPKLGPWLASLPQSHQPDVERRIEDFRERWVSFLDDMKQWLERVSEMFGVGVPVYIERPHKL